MSGQTKQVNTGLFSRLKDSGSGKALRQVATNFHSEESTAGQTVINLPYVVELDNIDNFLLFVDGTKLSQEDYSFTSVLSGKSNEITLSSPLIAGLEIEAYLLAVALSKVNQLTLESQIRDLENNLRDWGEAGFEDFRQVEMIDAPFTEISGRAQVPSGLETGMGVERIMTRSITLLQGEFGPNGEAVYEADNKDSRIRFVGEVSQEMNDDGAQIALNDVGEFIEVTFYGTALNILDQSFAGSVPVDITIDGGSPSSVEFGLQSSILANRNYAPNVTKNIVSGLALGWHTAKIEVTASSSGINCSGIEIINEVSQITSASGSGFSGTKKESLVGQSSIDYTPVGMTSGNGGRVVTYLKDGQLGQVFTEVPGSPSYTGSANHDNEELVRKIFYREFGAARGDDFDDTTFPGPVDRAFALDDGTTKLWADNISFSSVGLGINFIDSTSELTISFVGTGLDIIGDSNSAITMGDLLIDGENVGTWSRPTGRGTIVSGLPYGTHTVQFKNNVSGSLSRAISDFVIYQPKKPELPAGAVELADYNVMADFQTADGYTGDALATFNQGIIYKDCTRELAYFSGALSLNLNRQGGHVVLHNTDDDYFQYEFFGTGIVIYGFGGGGSENLIVEMDGAPYTGAATPVDSPTGGISGSWTPGTSTWNPNTEAGARLEITGLSLGAHTLKLSKSGGGGSLSFSGLGIITPIHINDSSLKVGNSSMKSQQNTKPVAKEEVAPRTGEAKALLIYDQQAANTIIYSKNISSVLDVSTGVIDVYFEKQFKHIPVATGVTNVQSFDINDPFNVVNRTHMQLSGKNSGGSNTDSVYFVAFFGELEDEE